MMVYTYEYARAHGEKPNGYGEWWFCDSTGTWVSGFVGTYTEAKKNAIESFSKVETNAKLGKSLVVLP